MGAAIGWVGGKLLERALAAMPEPPNTENLLRGLWSIKADDLGGLTYPITNQENRPPAKISCWFTIKVQARNWVSPDGNARHCEPFPGAA